MNLNSITADKAAPPQSTSATSGGESFQLAYAKVYDGRYAPIAPDVAQERTLQVLQEPVRPNKTAHTIHAGETLTGIARARLATLGAAADTGALRESIAQLAKANNIRNPDRIYVGQKLDLSALDAAYGHKQAAVAPAPATTVLRDSVTPLVGGPRFDAGFDISLPAQSHADDMIVASAEPTATAQPAPLPVALPPFPRVDAFAGIDTPATAQMPPIDPLAARQIALYTQNAAAAPEKPAETPGMLSDIIHKGVAGKVLDALPIEPSTRANLQRANTIVSSAFTARSLGALTGLGGPILTVAGLLWGVFSSRQSEAVPTTEAKPATNTTPVADAKPAVQIKVADALN